MAETWLHPVPAFPSDEWSAGWTDSTGPDFRPDPGSAAQAEAVATLVRATGLEAAAWARQVHGETVLKVDRPGLAGEADALWTDAPGLGLIGRSADCPLVLIGGRRQDRTRLWGFAHASWRCTVRGITGKLLSRLAAAGADPATLAATICPSAGPCCYEVGPEVREEAQARLGPGALRFFRPAGDRWILDLWAANITQLVAAGLAPNSIHAAGLCTICGGSTYPSYRRDGSSAGRFAGIIGGRQLPSKK